MNESAQYWIDYIENHPENKTTVRWGANVVLAPYKGGQCVRVTDHRHVIFYNDENLSKWHRLDGPAWLSAENGESEYYINDQVLRKEQFDKHPLVIEHRLQQILDEVLDE